MHPFSRGDTYNVFKSHLEGVLNKIKSLENDYILNASKAELEEYYIAEAMVDELALNIDSKYIDNKRLVYIDAYDNFHRTKYKVPGTSLDLCIPYTGDKSLFELRASTYSLSGYPEISFRGNEVVITISYQDSNADGEKIKRSMESDLNSIIDAVAYVNEDVRMHNSKVASSVIATIEKKIHNAKKSMDVLDILDIPIKRKDEPDSFVVDVKRKIKTNRSNTMPKATVKKYEPEPSLDMDEYNHILGVLRGMSNVIERSPKSFLGLDEEAIRTHFLLQLNGHYEGNASGETFNKTGKTDILIKVNDKNIFIGECKFWKGPKSFHNAIDQLLGYLAWRDTKCALLIFNKSRNSSNVANKMHQIMQERAECKKVVAFNPEGDSQYIFVKDSDPGREILITTQLYDLPDN